MSPGWQFRPAKQIQRLMAVDAMRRLSHFQPLHEYRYVGMGGYEFVDFDLVHRALGVHLMTSIESKIDEERLKFNRPFPDIDLRIGTSNEVLPTIPMDGPMIVWMDYCSQLRHDVLQDLRLLGEQLPAGSMLIATVNAYAAPEDRFTKFESRVGRDRVPLGVDTDKDLDGWAMADVQRRVMLTEIGVGLSKRKDSPSIEQVLNIQYIDTQRMQTLGVIFLDPSCEEKFAAADYSSLEYVRTEDAALRIKVPILTAREVLQLESKLEKGGPVSNLDWLDPAQAESFAELHRWYPRVPAPM